MKITIFWYKGYFPINDKFSDCSIVVNSRCAQNFCRRVIFTGVENSEGRSELIFGERLYIICQADIFSILFFVINFSR